MRKSTISVINCLSLLVLRGKLQFPSRTLNLGSAQFETFRLFLPPILSALRIVDPLPRDGGRSVDVVPCSWEVVLPMVSSNHRENEISNSVDGGEGDRKGRRRGRGGRGRRREMGQPRRERSDVFTRRQPFFTFQSLSPLFVSCFCCIRVGGLAWMPPAVREFSLLVLV